ncbi:HAMP domain-containing protein, partial [Paenibacillus alginolyticus]
MSRQIIKLANVRGMMIRHYVILAVALSLAGSVIVFYLFYGLEKNYDDSLTNLVQARDVVEAQDLGPIIKRISEYGGWVEVLNDKKEVVQTLGKEKESIGGYTEDQLQQFLANDPNSDFYYSIAPLTGGGPSGYYLLKLPMELVDGNHIVNPTQQNRGIALYLATAIGAFAAVTVLFIWGYSRITSARINRPLEQLHAGMQEVMGGNYGARLHFDAAYEFQSIRDTFNYMVDKLQ